MKKKGRRLCSTLLSLSMIAGLLSPGTASAAELWKKSALSHVLSEAGQKLFGGGISSPDEDSPLRLIPATNTNAITIDDLISGWTKATESTIIKATDSNAEIATSSNVAAYSNKRNLGEEDAEPLADIIGWGGKAMFTTLMDEKGNVLSTNKGEDGYLIEDEDKLTGVEVDFKQGLYVKFELADIVPHDGTEGVQANTVYFMTLPDELVPMETDGHGNKLVDPDNPVLFFQAQDGIKASGGIYSVDGEYQLRMIFEDVEDQIDISGHFQYGVTINESLTPGESYVVDFVPGGKIKFSVAPSTPEEQKAGYRLEMSVGRGSETTSYWWVGVNKIEESSKSDSDSETEVSEFPYRELTISSDDAIGVWVNEANQGIFDGYGESDYNGPGCSWGITYETKDTDGTNQTEYAKLDKTSIIKNSDGNTVIRFQNQAGDLQADMEFKIEDVAGGRESGKISYYNDQFAYITNKVYIHISDGNGGKAKNIKNLAFYIPTLTYDDYCQVGSNYYRGKAVLSAGEDDTSEQEIPELKAENGGFLIYGDLGQPSIGGGPQSPTDSYEFLPDRLYTVMSTGNSYDYMGNYYWMEFDPGVENTSGVNYYLPNWTFAYDNNGNEKYHFSLSQYDDDKKATFRSFSSLNGKAGTSKWKPGKMVYTGQLKGDSNLLADIGLSGSEMDVKLQYQLKKVFADAKTPYMVLYQSESPNSYGEYSYLVIDPETVWTAEKCRDNGWNEYVEGYENNNFRNNDGSAKAASFKIHVFNAPGTNLILDADQMIGSVIADNQTYDRDTCYIKDQVQTGIKDSQIRNSYNEYHFRKYPASYMSGVWADEDTVFWEFTFDAKNWPASNTWFSDYKQGTIYAHVDENQTMWIGDKNSKDNKSVEIEGQKLEIKNIYVKNPKSKAWERVGVDENNSGRYSWGRAATSADMTDNTTLAGYGDYRHLFRFKYGGIDWTDYRDSSSQDVTIGFFTHVTGMPERRDQEANLSCEAEVVVRSGSVSKLYGDYNYDGTGYRKRFPDRSAGKNDQYPFKISSSGKLPVPTISKDGRLTVNSADSSKMTAEWTITADHFEGAVHQAAETNQNVDDFYGGYSGVLTITDDMNTSEVKDIDDQAVKGVRPEKYTYIKEMFTNGLSLSEINNGGGGGPMPPKGDTIWEKYDGGTWNKTRNPSDEEPDGYGWDPYNKGIYRYKLITYGSHETNPVELYVYYAGNMSDNVKDTLSTELKALGRNDKSDVYAHPLVIEYRGLNHAISVVQGSSYSYDSPIRCRYTTEFDQKAFLEAENKALGKEFSTAYYQVTLKNHAGFANWTGENAPQGQVEVTKKVSAVLAIEKTASGIEPQTAENGYVGTYKLYITNGVSPSQYIAAEDFLTGFENVSLGANGSLESNKSYDLGENQDEQTKKAVAALARHMKIEGLKITAKYPEASGSTVIYRNGGFISNWSQSTLSLNDDQDYSSERPGSLFQMNLKNSTADIPAGMEFTVEYSGVLEMDTADSELGGKTFRESEYYQGSGLRIKNNAEASRTYTTAQTKSHGLLALFADDNRDAGTELLLTVDCGASVGCTYLTKDVVQKNYYTTRGTTSQWLSYVYTGTSGKGSLADPFELNDSLGYKITKFKVKNPKTGDMVSYDDDSLGETLTANLETLLEHLVEKNSTYKNIKVYYTSTAPNGNGTNISDSDLIWTLDPGVSGGTEITDGGFTVDEDSKNLKLNLNFSDAVLPLVSKNWPESTEDATKYPGMQLKFTMSPATLGMSATDPEKLSHGHAGFKMEASGLEREKYLVCSYDIETDWDKVYEEAYRILGGIEFTGSLKNRADDGPGGSQKESVGNRIEIMDTTLDKKLTTPIAKDGTAEWKITASTGSMDRDKLELEDHVQIKLPAGAEERVKDAAEAATSIDPDSIVIKKGNTEIYNPMKAEFDQGYRSGWDNNLTVTVENGTTLKVTIENQPDDTVLQKNQTYYITYHTVFNPTVFFQNGGKRGDTYTLANGASFNYGELSRNAADEDDFIPDVPVTAKKSVGVSNGNTQQWVATAGTGKADRKNFQLSDQVSMTGSKADEFQKALYIDEMSVKVTDATNHETEYSVNVGETETTLVDSEGNQLDKVTLTDSDGNQMKLGQVGVRGFVLTFESLPADYQVQVTYVTAVDREKFLEKGGTDNMIVELKNQFHVKAEDGNEAEDGKDGEVIIKAPFTKNGVDLNKKTADGNPIIPWTMNVNLTSRFSMEELKKMREVTLTDDLNPALKVYLSSVKLVDSLKVDITSSCQIRTEGNRLMVTLENPAEHPNFTLTFETECQSSLEKLSNEAALYVEGKKETTAKSDDIKDLKALNQHGLIQSYTKPQCTIEAWKYVDHEICTEAGKYRFELTAVDADGKPLTGENAYSEIMTNDADGKINFSTINYKSIRADAVTYYYQIQELPDDVDGMVLDNRVFTVEVDIQKEGSKYRAYTKVISPENYSRVEFDNTTKPKLTDFTVTKVWDDNDNAAGLRPDTIIVHLYQDGQPYNNMMVTLNEGNNWTYTWTDLPIAGGEYSAVEDPVEGYEGSAVTANNETVLTNKIVDQPDKPDQPGKPDQPTTPDQPNTPDTPATPDHPTNPGNPGRPHHYRDTDNSGDNPSSPTPTEGSGENPTDSDNQTDNHNPSPLPKTGQLWWPVLILLILGAVMLGRGIYMERKNKGKHEK